MKKLSFCLLFATSACGGSTPSTAIDVEADRVSVVAARDVDGAWEVLALDAGARARFEADGPFELVGRCRDDGVVRGFVAGPEDAARAFSVGCAPVRVPVTVNNPTAQSSYVWIGDTFVLVEAGGTTTLMAAPGVRDVVVQQGVSVGIRRDVSITEGATVDLTALALRPLVMREVISNITPDGVGSFIDTGTTRGGLWAGEEGATVPPELAEPGDRHYLQINDVNGTGDARTRAVTVDPAASGPVRIDVAPFIGSATIGDGPAVITFSAPGPWDQIVVTSAGATAWVVTTYPGAGAADGTSAPFDPSAVPGWDPAWVFETDTGASVRYGLARVTADGFDAGNGQVLVPPR